MTTRIVELDRGLLRSYPGNFAAYEARKADQLAAESVANRKFDTFWKQEEAWIRKGVEARRTRDMGRVRRLEAVAARARRSGASASATSSSRSTPASAPASWWPNSTGVGKRFGERTLVRDLDLRVMRGDRLGLIGPNGAGKSTLLKLILGQLRARRRNGEARHASSQVAYFDQMRAQLDPERTLIDTISPGSDWVETAGGEQARAVVSRRFPVSAASAPTRR